MGQVVHLRRLGHRRRPRLVRGERRWTWGERRSISGERLGVWWMRRGGRVGRRWRRVEPPGARSARRFDRV